MALEQSAAAPVRTSRVGKRPIAVPKGVTVTTKGRQIEVKGPKGTLGRELSDQVTVRVEAGQVHVASDAPGANAARLQGTARAHINNMVRGVSEGYTKTLELVGTGYRAEVKGNILNLALGFSHPISFPLPANVAATVPGDSKGTVLILTGVDKDVMGQTAAKIRGFRPPEPYGGKGVRYRGEAVRRKAGKAGKGGKGSGKK
jgi:large subunit ribosomal protein L6